MQLLKPLDQKRKLRLEGCPGLIVVEGAKKRVVFRLMNELPVQPLGDHSRQRALADPDRTFDRNISRWFKEIRHALKPTPENIVCRPEMQLFRRPTSEHRPQPFQ